jgi:predicted  nucleic acid-binding Zn ribbon protein
MLTPKIICLVVNIAVSAANKHGIPKDVFIAIAIHESRMNAHARGDRGKSIGPWQINTAAHKLSCRSLKCQARFAAKMLKRLIRKRRRVSKAVQGWNQRSRGYSRRVRRKKRQARKMIKDCRRYRK